MYDPLRHHRKSIRLKGYDYRKPGAYFVTIFVRKRLPLFGVVKYGNMILNTAGIMVQKTWDEIPEFYPGVIVDSAIVMPDHFHGIIILQSSPEMPSGSDKSTSHYNSNNLSLPEVIGRFKSMTTTRYIKCVHQYGWSPFKRKLWHRNYYEHIIRNKRDLNRIQNYIHDNPANL